MFSLIKKNWLLVFLAFLAVVLAALWILNRAQRREELSQVSPPPLPSSRFLQTIEGETFTITAQPPPLPSQLAIYKTVVYTKEAAAASFGPVFKTFKMDPDTPPRETRLGALVWDNPSGSLLIDLPSGRFSYSGQLKAFASFTSASAQAFALNEVASWDLPLEFRFLKTRLFVVTNGHIKEVEREEASVFSIFLQPLISGIPVVGAGTGKELVELRATADGEIISFTFDIATPEPTGSPAPVKSWGEILSEVNSGRVSSLWAQDEEGSFVQIEEGNLRSSTLSSAYLAYFDSGEEQILYQPVVVFEGAASLSDGREATIAVFVPALKN